MTNRIALITGGSRGIGAAIALEFAKNNIDTVISYKSSEEEASNIVRKAESFGVRAIAIRADNANESEIVSMFNKIRKDFGNISYLVNNAAISDRTTSIEDINFDILEEIFRANFFGAAVCCREALKQMKEVNGDKAIVNISSEAGKSGGRDIMAHYASSKAALNIFTKSIARDFVKYGIRVNGVSPAVIDTDVHKNISDERRRHFENTIPMKRMGKVEEVANLVYFLISDKSSYINGEIVPINGGK